MTYFIIFASSYFLVSCGVFFWMSQTVGRTADSLKSNGVPDDIINEHYKKMGAIAIPVLLRSTAVIGSMLGAAVSLLYFLFSK